MARQLDEAAKQILGTLLADFTDQGLSADDLKKGYEGPKIEILSKAVCFNDELTEVDFSISFSDLEKAKLIKTGPMKMHDNKPGSSVIVIGFYSEKIYAYLTQEGYKAARKSPNKPRNSIQRIINQVTISGGNFNNLQLAAGAQVSQDMAITHEANTDIALKLISILENQGVTVTNVEKECINNAIDEANQGNAGNAKKLLMKACGSAWEHLQSTVWPIIGEVIKKSMDI